MDAICCSETDTVCWETCMNHTVDKADGVTHMSSFVKFASAIQTIRLGGVTGRGTFRNSIVEKYK
jgi:hypothetical protein